MIRAFVFAALITTVGLVSGVPVTENAAAWCIQTAYTEGCLEDRLPPSPVPIPCQPFEGKKYLENLNICFY